jgi:hypothetical protein
MLDAMIIFVELACAVVIGAKPGWSRKKCLSSRKSASTPYQLLSHVLVLVGFISYNLKRKPSFLFIMVIEMCFLILP